MWPTHFLVGKNYSHLGKLENAPIIDTMLKEVVGINAPKILLTRSHDERRDAFYSEAGNTIGFFGAGLTLNAILNAILNPKKLLQKSQSAYHWGVIGRSAAIASTSFAILWAMPFVRNYLTAKKIGNARFTQIIGAQSGQTQDTNEQNALAKYKRTAFNILSMGFAGSILAIGGARLAIARNWGEKTVNRLFENPKSWMHQLTLKDGSFSNFSGLPALLFWGVPAYGGWIQASRDPYERKEQVLKFTNFVAGFFGPSVVLRNHYQKKLTSLAGQDAQLSYNYITKHLNGETQGKALKIWATKTGVSLLSSIVILSTLPQLINIFLTKHRLTKAATQSQQTAASLPPSLKPPIPGINIMPFSIFNPNTASLPLRLSANDGQGYFLQNGYGFSAAPTVRTITQPALPLTESSPPNPAHFRQSLGTFPEGSSSVKFPQTGSFQYNNAQ